VTGYLQRMAARAAGREPAVTPRLPSRFEAADGTVGNEPEVASPQPPDPPQRTTSVEPLDLGGAPTAAAGAWPTPSRPAPADAPEVGGPMPADHVRVPAPVPSPSPSPPSPATPQSTAPNSDITPSRCDASCSTS